MQKISFGQPHHHFQECASTNTLAMLYAKEGAPEGTVVSADFQTQGRGRMGRQWNAMAGENLLFSLILRPILQPERWGLITLTAALSLSKMLVQKLGNTAQIGIKWSNDVLLNDKKVSGMLLESSIGKDNIVILGVGLNVNQTIFPSELTHKATSLALETGFRYDIEDLMAAFLEQFASDYYFLQLGNHDKVLFEYLSYLKGLHRPIQVHQLTTNETVTGILRGVDVQGALLLELPNGTHQTFYSGEVSLQHSYTQVTNHG